MASPSPDGAAVVANGGAANSTGQTLPLPALTTAVSGDEIFVSVSYEGGSVQRNVSTVTSANLTFTLRAKAQRVTGLVGQEVWVAKAAGILSAEVITITLDGICDAWCVAGFGVKGMTSKVFDGNGSLPAAANGSGTSGSVAGVSTTSADDLLLAFFSGSNNGAPTNDTGWTNLVSQTSFHGAAVFSAQSVEYKSVSATQSAVTVNSGVAGSTMNWVFIADAVTSDVVLVNPASQSMIVG